MYGLRVMFNAKYLVYQHPERYYRAYCASTSNMLHSISYRVRKRLRKVGMYVYDWSCSYSMVLQVHQKVTTEHWKTFLVRKEVLSECL